MTTNRRAWVMYDPRLPHYGTGRTLTRAWLDYLDAVADYVATIDDDTLAGPPTIYAPSLYATLDLTMDRGWYRRAFCAGRTRGQRKG